VWEYTGLPSETVEDVKKKVLIEFEAIKQKLVEP
jgi:hypothetical protein